MTYELAKQLKDAGYPFKEHPEYQSDKPLERYKDIVHFGETIVYLLPTLSELIEACGDSFKSLVKSKKCEGKWIVTSNVYTSKLLDLENTPEEAVAKLWLELNKKMKIDKVGKKD